MYIISVTILDKTNRLITNSVNMEDNLVSYLAGFVEEENPHIDWWNRAEGWAGGRKAGRAAAGASNNMSNYL